MKIMQKKIVQESIFWTARALLHAVKKKCHNIDFQTAIATATTNKNKSYPTHLINLSIVETTGVQCALV